MYKKQLLELVSLKWFNHEDISFSVGPFFVVLKQAWWAKPPENLRREIWVYFKGKDQPEEVLGPFKLHEVLNYIEENF